MHGNGRPLGTRKRMQVLVAVVLLAWATQTLLHQWGFGAEAPREGSEPAEKFVPGTARFAAGATLEIRGEASVVGSDVKLKQVCRWSDSDAPVFTPVADLVIARLKPRSPFRAITLDELKTTLHDAGVNLAIIKFAGPVSCTVSRSDGDFDEATALRQWAEAKEEDTGTRGRGDAEKEENPASSHLSKLPSRGPSGAPRSDDLQSVPASPRPRVPASSSPVSASTEPVRTLRSLLINDLAVRLTLPEEQLQVTFNPKDEKLLNLSEPLFKFNIEPRRVRNLGEVSWNVLVVTGAGSQKGVVTANARAWQTQVVVTKPLSYHQIIRPSDVAEQRILTDRLPDDPLLTNSQVVGQQGARDLKPGAVMTSRLIDAVPLVKPGQTVSITLQVGGVQVKTVARAMESGAYGQTVKVRNETTRDVFDVIMTGPQEGSMGPLPASSKLAAGE